PSAGARDVAAEQESLTPTRADNPSTSVLSSAKRPRTRAFATTHLRVVGVLAALVVHGVWHTSATALLLALSPLGLLIGRDPTGQWALRGALAWLLLAAADLVYPMASAGPEPHHFVAIAVLMFVLWRLHRAHATMHELIRRDPLTGLLNRRGFEEAATRELHRAARYARPLAFALIDIDRFKAANDRLGHAFGDFVLQTVADELGRLRGSDLAVRLGGDEFGVLMPETDQGGAELLLQRVQQNVEERTAERGWSVTLSVGVVGSDTLQQARSMEAIMAEADRRMYGAKRHSSRAIFHGE
ncbi:MAG TPA: GGDEF domain-containing protein, partial [Polyangiales bacterium]|nr:GGDEF domain-containing protein [Polyangiales bacterium]